MSQNRTIVTVLYVMVTFKSYVNIVHKHNRVVWVLLYLLPSVMSATCDFVVQDSILLNLSISPQLESL